jgi:hypothetical protein
VEHNVKGRRLNIRIGAPTVDQLAWLVRERRYTNWTAIIEKGIDRLFIAEGGTMDTEKITEIEVAANVSDWWDHNVYGEMAANGQYVDRDATQAAYTAAVTEALRLAHPAAEITVTEESFVPGAASSLRVNGVDGHSLAYEVEYDLEQVTNRMDALTVLRTYSIEICTVEDLTALDLRRYAGTPAEAARVTVEGQVQRLDVLYVPEDGRAGIADGADADWTDANSLEDAVQRYLGGGMTE